MIGDGALTGGLAWEALNNIADMVRGTAHPAQARPYYQKALEIADRAYVLELGRNRFEGTGAALLADPDVKRLYLGG